VRPESPDLSRGIDGGRRDAVRVETPRRHRRQEGLTNDVRSQLLLSAAARAVSRREAVDRDAV
jgi:hypothetical protein